MGILLAQIPSEADVILTILDRYGLVGVVLLVVAAVMWWITRTESKVQSASATTSETLAKIALSQHENQTKSDVRHDKLREEIVVMRVDLGKAQAVQELLEATLRNERNLWSAERAELQTRINELSTQLKLLEKTVSELKGELSAKRSEIADLTTLKNQVEAQLLTRSGEVSDLLVKITILEGLAERQRKELEVHQNEAKNGQTIAIAGDVIESVVASVGADSDGHPDTGQHPDTGSAG